MHYSEFEHLIEERITKIATPDDPAHDLLHFRRVVAMSKRLCKQEHGNMDVVVPAAWLHDFVNVPKDSPLRSQASRLSGEKAIEFLQEIQYPKEFFADITHAIEAHSFSANIETRSLEARIVQDADRLDGLGAVGIARCFATSSLLKRPFYSAEDPFCKIRLPDDLKFTIDHFYKKLFKTVDTLKTAAGVTEGRRRAEVMKAYLASLAIEIV